CSAATTPPSRRSTCGGTDRSEQTTGPDATVRAPWTVTAVPSVVHDHLGLIVDVGDVGLLELTLQAVVDLVLVAGRVAELLDTAVGHPGVLDLALHEVRLRVGAPVDRGALE